MKRLSLLAIRTTSEGIYLQVSTTRTAAVEHVYQVKVPWSAIDDDEREFIVSQFDREARRRLLEAWSDTPIDWS